MASTINALSKLPELPEDLYKWIDPSYNLLSVKHVACLYVSELSQKELGVIVVGGPTVNYLLAIEGDHTAAIQIHPSNILTTDDIEKVWTAAPNALILLAKGSLWLVRVYGECPTIGYHADVSLLVNLPVHAIDGEIDVTWDQSHGLKVALFEQKEEVDNLEPLIFPQSLPSIILSAYNALDGWVEVSTTIPPNSEGLTLSESGTCAAWRVMANHIPEEAERGEIYIVDVCKGGNPRQATKGAGRVAQVKLSPDGSYVVYAANYSQDRPITTHLSLWRLPVHSNQLTDPIRITPNGRSVEGYGFLGEALDYKLWVSFIKGSKRVTEIIKMSNPIDSAIELYPSIKNRMCCDKIGEIQGYPTESYSDFVTVQWKGSSVSLPHDKAFDQFVLEPITWVSSDGTPVSGLLCSLTTTLPSSTLLVHVHGGPAVAFAEDRSVAADSTRYPYRHLLAAGYRVFQPFYRGTLGFGDDFAQGNICRQGYLEKGDLGDIISGVDYLINTGKVNCGTRLGIFGGSYGGYMTMRALATTNRFKAGVAMYGFVHLRWMSYEGGDFTWEDEYCGERSWPLPEANTISDNFQHLGSIISPTLFLHGAIDDICPFSQSAVAYRALHERGIPTGLVSYPGERHGFTKPANRKDRDRRVLAWFLQYLPPTE